MKNLASLLGIILLVVLIFSGCSSSNESNSKKIAEQFVKELYSVNAEQLRHYSEYTTLAQNFSNETFIKATKSLNLVDGNMENLMTIDAFKAFRANREGLRFVVLCTNNDYTVQVTDVTLTKKYYDSKNNDAGYDFKVKMKLISNKTKEEKVDTAIGNIGLSKENGQWKISSDKMLDGPNLLINMK